MCAASHFSERHIARKTRKNIEPQWFMFCRILIGSLDFLRG